MRRDYLEDGSIFGFSKDKDGKKLFIIKSKLHVKGTKDFPELQRCIVYWFERLERYLYMFSYLYTRTNINTIDVSAIRLYSININF